MGYAMGILHNSVDSLHGVMVLPRKMALSYFDIFLISSSSASKFLQVQLFVLSFRLKSLPMLNILVSSHRSISLKILLRYDQTIFSRRFWPFTINDVCYLLIQQNSSLFFFIFLFFNLRRVCILRSKQKIINPHNDFFPCLMLLIPIYKHSESEELCSSGNDKPSYLSLYCLMFFLTDYQESLSIQNKASFG